MNQGIYEELVTQMVLEKINALNRETYYINTSKITAVQNVFHRPKCYLIVRRLWPEKPILQNQSPCIKIKWAVE